MGHLISRYLERITSERRFNILMVGLAGAGKTTILNRLKLPIQTVVHDELAVETLKYKNVTIIAFDLGNSLHLRFVRRYYKRTQAIIYVVDSNDVFTDYFTHARAELHKLLKEEDLTNSLLLVMANKQDCLHVINTDEMTDKLQLREIVGTDWFIQGTCATSGHGIDDGLSWLANTLKKRGLNFVIPTA
ncbi:adp-ribosylation factor 4, related [Paraphysoderma sedebokerense]|nr:adp-ribosylation factor 4, related [Paraphysoderma sedebokerense]KAI9138026.1 adp-ribosylation factor 4, related [Paraphysoderma sedebokerense]